MIRRLSSRARTTRELLLAGSCCWALLGCSQRPPRWRYGPEHAETEGAAQTAGPTFDPVWMERAMVQYGCTGCHTFHGERLVGPPLGGGRGETRIMTDGTTAVVDLEYLTESILAPERRVPVGYSAVMPSYADMLDEPTATRMAAYLLSLR